MRSGYGHEFGVLKRQNLAFGLVFCLCNTQELVSISTLEVHYGSFIAQVCHLDTATQLFRPPLLILEYLCLFKKSPFGIQYILPMRFEVVSTYRSRPSLCSHVCIWQPIRSQLSRVSLVIINYVRYRSNLSK